MTTIALHALGCRLNEAELEQTARVLEKKGHRIVRLEDQPEIILFNTCSVTTEAMRKSRQTARKLCANTPKCLVIMGCALDLMPPGENFFAQDASPEESPKLLLIRGKDKPRAGELVAKFIEDNADLFEPTPSRPNYRSHTRAFIKIEDGCNNRCSYCSVRLARGLERSETTQSILSNIHAYSTRGIQEIILTGVQLGAWKENERRLPDLLRLILRETDIPRIRLSSIEPWHMRESLWSMWCDEPRLCPHFHIPVQSGSHDVLAAMRRRTPIPAYLNLLRDLRAHIPDVRISTDLIVGFPGETEAHWQETLQFLDDAQLDDAHLFRFSARPGTEAHDMPGQIPPEIKKQRWNEAEERIQKHAAERLKSFVGKTYPVLWESSHAKSQDPTQTIGGYSPNYLRFERVFPNPAEMRGQITMETFSL